MKYDLSEVTEIIRNRRTIYPEQYSTRVVQRDMVEHMLNNALWAPTHGRTQPWRFTVFMGEGRSTLIHHIEQLHLKINSENHLEDGKLDRIKSRIDLTSVIIAVVMARTPETKIPEVEEVIATACAAQNMMLTATAYGLGAYWSSPGFLFHPDAPVEFGYAAEDRVLGLIHLGYPSGEWPKSHRKPLEYVTKWVG